LGLLTGCTTIPPVASTRHEAGTDASGGNSGSAGDLSTTPMTESGRPTALANATDACSSEGARICETGNDPVPLQCMNSIWMRMAPCADGEHCETLAGPSSGQCVEDTPDCRDGEKICAGEDTIRSCRDHQFSPPETCGASKICSPMQLECVCGRGSLDLGDGKGCQVPKNCDVGQGGCDPHSMCSIRDGKRECSVCDPGYSGTGADGCAPLLSDLSVSAGSLVPTFSPLVQSYRLRLTLLQQSVTFTGEGPSDARLSFNEIQAPLGTAWPTPVLPLGERTIDITLATLAGPSTRYQVIIERSGEQAAFIKAKPNDQGDHMGSGIALYEDTMVVGALFEDGGKGGVNPDPSSNGAVDSGAAYVFVRHDNSWVQEAYLKAETPVDNGFCGIAVAIWKDTIAMGCVRASEFGNGAAMPGEAYVYVRNGGKWTQQARLTLPGNDINLFGHTVALEGDRLAIGAPYEDTGGANAGALYVYERSGDKWGEPVRLAADQPHTRGSMGWSVALSGDRLVAGSVERVGLDANPNGPGAAFVYTHSSSGWSAPARLPAPKLDDGATFGGAVAISGDTIVVGASRGELLTTTPAGEAFVFDRSGDTWGFTQKLVSTYPRNSNFFGGSVALSPTTLVVGAPGDTSSAQGINGDPSRNDVTNCGSFYIYGREGGKWAQSAYVKAKNAQSEARFGESLAMYGDTVVTGAAAESHGSEGVNPPDDSSVAIESGAAYVFR
jgi:hypothetical protein